MRSALVVFLMLVIGRLTPAFAANEPLKFEIPVSSGLSTYVDTLLVSPAYAALALQNAGLPIALTTPIKLLNRQSFQVGPGKVSFQKKKDKIYFYTASVVLPLGKEISFPVEIDVSDMHNGRLQIRAYSGISALIPKDILFRVESRLQVLANANSQKQLIAYLAEHSGGKLGDAEAQSKFFDAIMFDAFNNSGRLTSAGGSTRPREAGSAEPLTDQMALILAVIIWLVGFPIYLFITRRQRRQLIDSAKTQ
jgi:hypothetical protein